MTPQPDFKLKELNYSGASHLYTATPSRTNVVQVALVSPVDGETLQMAVEDALERMPYFADALREQGGLFYYAKNDLPFEVCEGGPREVGGPRTNWHLVDVTYEKNTVYFSMFHAFCDGQGMNFFVEATLYHYFCRKDGVEYPNDGIRAKGTPALEAEELDPASHGYEFRIDPTTVAFYKGPALQRCVLPETNGDLLDHIHASVLRVDEGKLVSFARSCGSSPAPTIAALMADAIADVHPELAGDICVLVPASARALVGAPNTFKNCSMATKLHFDTRELDTLSFGQRAAGARTAMRAQLDPNMAGYVCGGIYQSLVQAQGAAGYDSIRRLLGGGGGSAPSTFVLDYVGKMRLNGYDDQIASVRFLASGSDDGNGFLTLMVSSSNGTFEILPIRNFASDAYDTVLARQLEKHGLHCEVGQDFTFLTPQNGLVTSLGLA